MDRQHYATLTALDMARLVRTREASPVELVRASLEAIAATEPAINAWSEVLGESALAHAATLEAEALKGEFRGPLHGVPVGIKDLFQVEGTRTRRG